MQGETVLTASLKAAPSPETSVPGFFGTMRAAPDLESARRSMPVGIHLPEIPAQLRARAASGASRILPKRGAKSLRRDAASFEHRLLQRVSQGPTLVDLEEIEALGARKYLERQLDPGSIDDFGLEDLLLEAFPTLSMSPWEVLINFHEQPEIPIYELWIATLYRSIYSPRQLLDRVVEFWTDHFNVPVLSDLGPWLKPTDDREVIRAYALGTFGDLLHASARSAAMLSYLTNDTNVKEHPNENYARELMELHTLGAEGGYTEADVKEVARCLTGWTFRSYEEGPSFGGFFFDAVQHDAGEKTVLGHVIPAGGGVEDGYAVLDILIAHPSTARFVATKLLRRFWGYEPPDRAVDRIAGIYQATGGDISSMLRGILSWSRLATATPKLKRPYHLTISAVRALFAQVENPFFLLAALDQAGQLPYTWAPPNGFPDAIGYWSGFVLPRWNYASLVVLAEEAGIHIDLPFLDPQLPAGDLRFILDVLLLGGTMTPETGAAVVGFLESRPAHPLTVREAISLVLASPEFQSY